MAVAPGVLLPPTPDVKPKAAAPKSQQKTPEPSNDKTSSFSDMYAKETAKKPAERADGPAKGSRDKPRDAGKEAAEAQPTDAAAQPAVAEDGKPLPADGQAKADGEDKVETPVDPLQLLGLGGAVPMLDENTQATLLPPAVPTASSAPASLTEASSDPTLVKLNGVPAVNMALEQGAQDAAQAAKGGPAKNADPRQANLGDALASLTSDSLPKAVDGKALEAQLQQTAEPAIASAASESLLGDKARPKAAARQASEEETAEERDQSPLFYCPGKRGFYAPWQGRPTPERINAFRNVGRIMGLCLLQNELSPISMCRHVYKYVLGRPVRFHDLAFFDPAIYESLRQLVVDAETKGDKEGLFSALDLSFR